MSTKPLLRALRNTAPSAALCLALVAASAMVRANDTSDAGPASSEYALAKQAMDDGDYEIAIDKLTKLHDANPDDADVLNLLGYGYRRVGDFAQSRGYYLQALAIDPGHRGANEYLGILYLETGDLAKAEEQLKVLDKECWLGCSEYTDLKEAIAKYKAEKGIK